MSCVKCGQLLTDCSAGISVNRRGDEVIYSYFLCAACDHWTVEYARDHFATGEDQTSTYGLSRADGDAAVAEIATCDSPHNKHCQCRVHDRLS